MVSSLLCFHLMGLHTKAGLGLTLDLAQLNLSWLIPQPKEPLTLPSIKCRLEGFSHQGREHEHIHHGWAAAPKAGSQPWFLQLRAGFSHSCFCFQLTPQTGSLETAPTYLQLCV